VSANGNAVSAETAQEFTEALGQVLAGAVRLTDVAHDVGVPQALGLTSQEWAERRLAGHVRLSIPERRQVVAELTENGFSKPEIAEALGVDESTVARDRRVSDDTPETPEVEAATAPPAVSDDTPRPTADPMAVHYSSETDEWATPQDFFDVVNAEFSFTLDVCALDASAKCEHYFTPEADGLAQNWTGTCWMNPPYGDVIGDWVQKAYKSSQAGATVVCLVPARTDTAWFHDYCLPGEVRLIRGRLRFGAADASAPFPSCLVVLGPDVEQRAFGWDWR
jgi:phage N-6-adenine-methyltransferase